MKLNIDAKFEEKMTRIWSILIRALYSLKNLHFDWCLSCKVYDLKRYIGVIFHDTELSSKIWKKNKQTDLWFWRWHEEFGKYTSDHLEVSRLGLWWDPFIQSRKCMSFKFTRELCVMAIKNDVKYEEELTC